MKFILPSYGHSRVELGVRWCQYEWRWEWAELRVRCSQSELRWGWDDLSVSEGESELRWGWDGLSVSGSERESGREWDDLRVRWDERELRCWGSDYLRVSEDESERSSKDAMISHESLVFTTLTWNVWGKSRTKASFSHLQLSVFEGGAENRWEKLGWHERRYEPGCDQLRRAEKRIEDMSQKLEFRVSMRRHRVLLLTRYHNYADCASKSEVSIPPSPGSFRPPSEVSFADHTEGEKAGL